jgi:hypothetical protein
MHPYTSVRHPPSMEQGLEKSELRAPSYREATDLSSPKKI